MTPDPQLQQAVLAAHRGAKRTPHRTPAQVRTHIKRTWKAVTAAEDARHKLARTVDPDNADRREILERHRAVLHAHMAPVRSELSRVWRSGALEREYGADLRDVSDAIQRERRKLWKMLNPKRVAAGTGA